MTYSMAQFMLAGGAADQLTKVLNSMLSSGLLSSLPSVRS